LPQSANEMETGLVTRLLACCCRSQAENEKSTSDDDQYVLKNIQLCCVKTETLRVDLRDGEEIRGNEEEKDSGYAE